MKYRCGYCQDDILGIRIRCNVCTDYELCLQVWQSSLESSLPYVFVITPTIEPVCWLALDSKNLLFFFLFMLLVLFPWL